MPAVPPPDRVPPHTATRSQTIAEVELSTRALRSRDPAGLGAWRAGVDRLPGIRRAAAALLAGVLLAGCSNLGLPQVHRDFAGLPADADPKSFTCCHDPERWPEAVANLSLAIAPVALELNPLDDGDIPGTLTGKTEAHQHIVDTARPLDLLLFANKTYIGGRFVPGRFTHSAIYLGTERELRAAGLWNDPAFVPLHDQIRAGQIFLEAFRPEVRLIDPATLLQTDSVAILRPRLSPGQRREAARRGVSKLGVPFDYWFDSRTTDTLACTELIAYAMPWIQFEETVSYGRPAVMPDSMVAQGIRGEGLSFVEHVRGVEGGGYVVEGPRGAMQDIAAFWGPPPV
ncbi:YiiX/YebB-like N1pC/P60 family cysteine hydrolase [Sinisalibacter aestuarii]|uniref:Permuted papain-like amidase YaeF/Yiix C92 family enzyme n=1 Tax=Sinisalibacter aestuarii TaxID=2949426 RepID=A0ABQ5LTI8_9RHOB|nr:YiiX/YebB-like N1pC/P60 family cysteine hydrolase [Sinisalibacter aestuarii]GKY88078.1 hypothetical protein STA1M1_19470 [Sinisalibacter aestuarii]